MDILANRAIGMVNPDVVVHALERRIQATERMAGDHFEHNPVASRDHRCPFRQVEVNGVGAAPVGVGRDRPTGCLKHPVAFAIPKRQPIRKIGYVTGAEITNLKGIVEVEAITGCGIGRLDPAE